MPSGKVPWPTGKAAYGTLPRITVWAACVFVALLLSLSLSLPSALANVVYGGLIVSACVAVMF
jgi:hypothetical protein